MCRIYHHKGMQYKVGYLGKIYRLATDGDWILCHMNTRYQKANKVRKITVALFFKAVSESRV